MPNRILPRASVVKLVVGLALTTLSAGSVRADGVAAMRLLKSMADYMASQPSLSVKYDSEIEVVTSDLEKIQFSASGSLALTRPDKFRVSRTGGYADVELVSDGSTVTILDRDGKNYAQQSVSGTFDQAVDRLRGEMLDIPGADLFLTNTYDVLTADVRDGRMIGPAVVGGVECDHLAFRNADTDWQIWIKTGDKPLPQKYVITSKTVTGAPQYTLRLQDWQTGQTVAADAFHFTPPEGAKRVEIATLRASVDEIPAAKREEAKP